MAACFYSHTIRSYAVLLMENLKKFWDGYSKTTQAHINDFRNAHNMKTLYKKDWESLSVENDPVSYYDHKKANMGNQYYGIPFACRW